MLKHIIILAVFLSIHSLASAAWNTIINSNPKARAISSQVSGDSLILVTGLEDITSWPQTICYAYDMDGNRKWTVTGNANRLYPSDEYILMARFGPLSFEGTNISFTHINYKGEYLKSATRFPEQTEIAVDVPMNYLEDGGILSVEENSERQILTCWAKECILTDTSYREFTVLDFSNRSNIKNATFFNDSLIAIATSDSLLIYDTEYQFINGIKSTAEIKGICAKDSVLYMLTPNTVCSFVSTSLHKTELLTDNTLTFSHFGQTNDSVWVSGSTDSETSFFYCTAASASLIGKTDRSTNTTTMHLSAGRVISSGTTENAQIFLTSKRITESDPFTYADITILDAELTDITFREKQLEQEPIMYDSDGRILIENLSDEPLTTFTVFIDLSIDQFTDHYYTEQITGISIAPHEQQWVMLSGNIFDYYNPNYELCFEVSSPNQHMESDYSNNSYCTLFKDVSTPEEESAIWLYPNPAKPGEPISIVSDNIASVQIVSAIGEKLTIPTTTNGQSVQFQLSEGVYFIQCQAVNKDWITKTVLVR